MLQIHLTEKELENTNGNGGIEIIIPGTLSNPQEELCCPVFIEKYEGKIRVIVWNGEEEPTITELKMEEKSDHKDHKQLVINYNANDELKNKLPLIMKHLPENCESIDVGSKHATFHPEHLTVENHSKTLNLESGEIS